MISLFGDPSHTLPVYASLRDRQDDATTNSGRGQAERTERSGLSVMLSGSETSYESKTAPLGDPSLTLRMTIRYFFVAMTKKVTIIIKKIV
jgi:hypothetical protein